MIPRIILKIKSIVKVVTEKAYLNAAKNRGLNIGKNNRLSEVPDFGSEPYLVSIGDNNAIASGVKFITHDGGLFTVNKLKGYENVRDFRRISVGNECFIGLNSILMPGAKMNDRCVLGSGSVLTSTMPEGTVYAGTPAKFICTLEEYAEKAAAKNTEYPRELEKNRKQLDEYLSKNIPQNYNPVK